MLVLCYVGTIVVSVMLIVTASAISMPTVSAMIGHIEVWASKVEIVAMGIACIDAEVPITTVPA